MTHEEVEKVIDTLNGQPCTEKYSEVDCKVKMIFICDAYLKQMEVLENREKQIGIHVEQIRKLTSELVKMKEGQ